MGGVLLVSPDATEAGMLARMVAPVSLNLEHAADLKQARCRLREKSFQVVLTEAQLPDGNWIDVLNLVNDTAPRALTIVTDPAADERLWAEVLNLGAYDLLVQPFDATEVQRILQAACRRSLQEPPGQPPDSGTQLARPSEAQRIRRSGF